MKDTKGTMKTFYYLKMDSRLHGKEFLLKGNLSIDYDIVTTIS